MTAPERIWHHPFTDIVVHDAQPERHWECNEYIRADLVQEIVAEAVQWQPITDETPTDTVLLLGWHGFGGAWETATDYWYNSRGKWYHGSATHWMPLPAPPASIRARGDGQPQEKGE